MAESLALHLDKTGYDHYIALGCSKAHCEVMHATWPAPEQPLSCAFSSEPFKSHPEAGLDSEWQRYLVTTMIGAPACHSPLSLPCSHSCNQPPPHPATSTPQSPALPPALTPPRPPLRTFLTPVSAPDAAERGYDVMLIETDFVFHHDIYPLLLSAPLVNFQIVSLKTGHHADAGAIYIRGSKAHKNGAALWVLREVR